MPILQILGILGIVIFGVLGVGCIVGERDGNGHWSPLIGHALGCFLVVGCILYFFLF